MTSQIISAGMTDWLGTNSADTSTQIQDALVELLASKPLDEISVVDIAKTAHVHRNTFYYHFQDKEAVVEAMLERAIAFATAADPTSITVKGDIPSWIGDFLRHVGRNAALFRAMISLGYFEIIAEAAWGRYHDSIGAIVLSDTPEGCDPDFFLRCKGEGMIAAAKTWIIGGCSRPQEEVLLVMQSILSS